MILQDPLWPGDWSVTTCLREDPEYLCQPVGLLSVYYFYPLLKIIIQFFTNGIKFYRVVLLHTDLKFN